MTVRMSRGEFYTVKEATRWLFTAYFCELGFIVGFPLFLLDRPVYDNSEGRFGNISDHLSAAKRFHLWWNAVQDRSARQSLLLRKTAHLYNRFVWVQLILWVVCSILKIVWIEMLLTVEASVNANVQTAPRDLSHAAFSGPKMYVLLAAFGVHCLQYIVHRYHLISCLASTERTADAEIHPWAYTLGHVSLINYAVDLPGLFMPDVKLSNTVVILINLMAVSMFAFLVLAEEPMSEAWGCYPSWYSIDQLDYGLCPAFLHKTNPESALAPVCTAVTGAECDGEGARWAATLNHAFSVARIMLFISLTFYAWSIPLKIDYYSLKYREARLIMGHHAQ